MTRIDGYNSASFSINQLTKDFPQKNGELKKLKPKIAYLENTRIELEKDIKLLNDYYNSGFLARVWKIFDSVYPFSPLAKANSLLEEVKHSEQSANLAYVNKYIKTYLTPYFNGKIDEQNQDKNRPPLIDKLYPEFKINFPSSQVSQGELEGMALDAYIKASLKQASEHSPQRLDPAKDFLPALNDALEIDFWTFDKDKLEAKKQEAVTKLIATQSKEKKESKEFLTQGNIQVFIISQVKNNDRNKAPMIDILYQNLKKQSPHTALHKNALYEYALDYYLEVFVNGFVHNYRPSGLDQFADISSRLKSAISYNFPNMPREIAEIKVSKAIQSIKNKLNPLV